MTRKKVKLAYITNDASRKATFKKRKKGLMKKVNELSTLCGINACAIIYSPYDSNPEVWPSNSGAQRIVSEFRTLPEMDQHKKMVDQETFLKQRISKAVEHLKRQRKDNRELEMTEVMFQCLVGNMGMFNLNIIDLNDLGYLIEQYLKDVNRRMEILQASGADTSGDPPLEIGESSNAVEAVTASSEGIGSMAIVAVTNAPSIVATEIGTSSVAPPNFFNLIQHHHHHHPTAPQASLYEQNQTLNLNQSYDRNQQQWFMETMNHHPDQRGFPFMNESRNHHQPQYHYHHHQPQQHQISGGSSAAPTTSNTSSVAPVSNPNLTQNLWFR